MIDKGKIKLHYKWLEDVKEWSLFIEFNIDDEISKTQYENLLKKLQMSVSTVAVTIRPIVKQN